jgi:hypothetical protein
MGDCNVVTTMASATGMPRERLRAIPAATSGHGQIQRA